LINAAKSLLPSLIVLSIFYYILSFVVFFVAFFITFWRLDVPFLSCNDAVEAMRFAGVLLKGGDIGFVIDAGVSSGVVPRSSFANRARSTSAAENSTIQ
jgi:hypothetical protein